MQNFIFFLHPLLLCRRTMGGTVTCGAASFVYHVIASTAFGDCAVLNHVIASRQHNRHLPAVRLIHLPRNRERIIRERATTTTRLLYRRIMQREVWECLTVRQSAYPAGDDYLRWLLRSACIVPPSIWLFTRRSSRTRGAVFTP